MHGQTSTPIGNPGFASYDLESLGCFFVLQAESFNFLSSIVSLESLDLRCGALRSSV